ncbi:hypothetical protein GCM10007301_17910 [Azorhizobium oxalatiphilum]|uniref:Uncharacterized protein n=1 Tax=Azorhizobium oxalatiphilum TaxID=980631 RepID=A0A917BWQ7_9HYPH|nr:hypothetical protein GCM10007301_17910 [Azorhizobium oxalatiphilum]
MERSDAVTQVPHHGEIMADEQKGEGISPGATASETPSTARTRHAGRGTACAAST